MEEAVMMRMMGKVAVVMLVLAGAVCAAKATEPTGARLEATLDGPDLKCLKQRLPYVARVTNVGDRPAAHVVAILHLSPNFKLCSVDDGGVYDATAHTVTWKVDKIRATWGREFRFECEQTVERDSLHKLVVTADDGLKHETDWARRLPSAFIMELDEPGPFKVGDAATYELRLMTFKARNNVRLNATIPDGMDFEGVEGLNVAVFFKNVVVFEPIQKLTRKDDILAKIRLKVRSAAADKTRVRVEVTSDEEPEPIIETSTVRIAGPRDPNPEFDPAGETHQPPRNVAGYGDDTKSLLLMVTPRIIINEEEEERATGVRPAGYTRLQLHAEGPRLKYVGRKAEYTLSVSAAGNTPAQNVVLTCHLPAGFQFMSADDGGTYDSASRTVTWKWGELPVDAARRVKLVAEAVNPGEWTHRVEVTAERGLGAKAEWVTRVQGVSTGLLDVSDDGAFVVGQDVTYEIRFSNTGQESEKNVRIYALTPRGMTFRSATGPTQGKCEGGQVVSEPLAKLAPRTDVIYRLTYRVTSAGFSQLKVAVTTDNITVPVFEPNEGTRVYDDEPAPQK
jgi:uncharacterized repeat protein (TIGR01451 family)